jgi:hypothetical protein
MVEPSAQKRCWLRTSRLPPVVAARSLLWVDAGRRDELGHAVSAEPDVPVGVVDDAVVSGAEEHALVDIGVAPSCPRVDVVRFAPAGRSVASREGTPAVADGETDTLTGMVEAALAAHGEDAAAAAHDHRQDAGGAGELADRFGADPIAV